MTKTYYEVQYGNGNGKWYRYSDRRYQSFEEAVAYAQSRCYDDNQTRVVKIEAEVIETFPTIPGKQAPPIVLTGLGVVTMKD